MSSFRIRPRFTQVVDMTLEDTRTRLLAHLVQCGDRFEVKDFPGLIGIHFHEDHRRMWSPRLFLNLEGLPDGKTRIEGIYGPEIEVWGIFFYGYLFTGMLGMFGGILGFAQKVIGEYPWGLWVLGGMALSALLLYLGAQFGQKLGAWQMFELHQAYQEAIGAPADLR
jgi:hypothetical protein